MNSEDKDFKTSELDDDQLNLVTGGEVVLSPQFAAAYLCPCDICGRDTSWYASDNGETYTCSGCGTTKSREWYMCNKIRFREKHNGDFEPLT